MSKPDDIPEDVWDEVQAINLALPYSHVQEQIARAILSERTKAAEIAQNMWADMLEDKDVRRMRQRNQWLLDAISQAIRKGGKE